MSRRTMMWVSGAVLALLPMPALGYSGIGSTFGIVQGFLHPIGGLDHALAMIAVGILAACIGGRALWVVPAAFIGCMVVGAFLGARRIDLPYYETGIALSVVLLGALIASGRNLPIAVTAGLAGLFALFHGYAHGAELPLEVSPPGYAAGFILATAALHAIGIGIYSAFAWLGPDLVVRARQVAGIAIALIGIAILARWL